MYTEVIKQRLTLFSFLSLWINIVTNSAEDLHEHNLTDPSCEKEFSVKLDYCVEEFLRFHHQLGLFSSGNRKISVIYISVHRDLYCRQYIDSLQCIHDNLSSCSTDKTTSLVQHKLSQLWALTANKICHINDKSTDKTGDGVNTQDAVKVIPDNIEELFRHGPVHILEESELLHDCTGRMLFENALADIKAKTLDASDEISEIDLNEADYNKHQNGQNENSVSEIEVNQSSETSLDYLVKQFGSLLQFLSYLFTPGKQASTYTKADEGTKMTIFEDKSFDTGDSRLQNIKVKYDTILLKKVKITNLENKGFNRNTLEQSRPGKSNKETFLDQGKDNVRSQTSVIKEFEISTEDKKSPRQETKTMTYKWKTKLKGVL